MFVVSRPLAADWWDVVTSPVGDTTGDVGAALLPVGDACSLKGEGLVPAGGVEPFNQRFAYRFFSGEVSGDADSMDVSRSWPSPKFVFISSGASGG